MSPKHLMMSLSCVRILWWDLDSMAWAIAPLRRSVQLTTLWFGFNHWFYKNPFHSKHLLKQFLKLYIVIYFVCILYTNFAPIFETIVVQYYQFIYMISTSSIMKFHLQKWIIFHFGPQPKWIHASRVPLWCSFLKGNNTHSVAMVLILGYSNILEWQPYVVLHLWISFHKSIHVSLLWFYDTFNFSSQYFKIERIINLSFFFLSNIYVLLSLSNRLHSYLVIQIMTSLPLALL